MNNEIKQNFEEKIRLVLIELKSTLEENFELMLRRHAADGLVRSGNTIKATMDMISRHTSELYDEILAYLDVLSIHYYSLLESDVSNLASKAQAQLKVETIAKFKKSTELAGNPSLYERMLPDLEAEMAKNLATFQNALNAKVLEIKHSTYKSPYEKLLWIFEAILLAISIFLAGMWFKDPEGNYEPILIGLGLIMPLVYLLIRRVSKSN